MDDRSLAWLQIGRAAVAESVKRAVLEIFPDPVDALKADLSVLRHGNQRPYRRQALDSFVNRSGLQRDIDWLSMPTLCYRIDRSTVPPTPAGDRKPSGDTLL